MIMTNSIIEERYNQEFESEKRVGQLLEEGKVVSFKNLCDSLWYKYELFIVHAIGIEKSYTRAKLNCYIAGKLNKYNVLKNNSRLFDYGLPQVCYVLLSDHEALIQRYAKLRYKAHGQIPDMDTRVLKGESPIWCNTIQFFMEDNMEGVKRNLDILEAITLKKLPKKEELLKIDYAYYQALLDKDKAKCEELLAELISPTIHKKRNDNPILNQYISQPALGYAKLAWRQGIKVEIDTPLIPKELLPIKPNDDYPIPYDFLKESYE